MNPTETAPGGSTEPAARPDLPTVDPAGYARGVTLEVGGMGRVVRAWDRRHGRAVALKECLSDAPAALARFEREALLTASLQHPAIVPGYEAGRW
ncbi:MAG: hypothetical protein KC583_15955, partial [Myxococcales bacterium]|nr:hypothetical protein [Myxococcales bacterium]